jgi:transposase
MAALTAEPNAAVQMIDTSMVRVHQHAACIADSGKSVGRTSKLHVVVDGKGLPLRLGITAGQTHDNRLCSTPLSGLTPRTMLLAVRRYDAGWIRALVNEQGAWANIPPKPNRRQPICFGPHLYRARNLIERFFNKIKHCRRIATRYDKLAAKRARHAPCDVRRGPREGYVERDADPGRGLGPSLNG